MDATLLLGIALSLVNAFLYALVGRAIIKRRVSKEGQAALLGFAGFWFGLAFFGIVGVIMTLVAQFGVVTTALYLTYLEIVLLIIMLLISGLLYYLVVVYTGWIRSWIPIVAGYLLVYFALLYGLNYAEPNGLIDGPFGPELTYERDLESIVWVQILGALLTLPSIVAAIAYGLLLRKVENRSQRFRIGSVSLAVTLWFGSSLVVPWFSEVDTNGAGYRLFTSIVAAVASLMVWAAFDPPQWLQRRLRIEGFADATGAEAGK